MFDRRNLLKGILLLPFSGLRRKKKNEKGEMLDEDFIIEGKIKTLQFVYTSKLTLDNREKIYKSKNDDRSRLTSIKIITEQEEIIECAIEKINSYMRYIHLNELKPEKSLFFKITNSDIFVLEGDKISSENKVVFSAKIKRNGIYHFGTDLPPSLSGAPISSSRCFKTFLYHDNYMV